MGIRFQCPACGAKLNVKSELGGKRGVCPKCQAKIQIPADSAQSPEAAPVPAPAATPAASVASQPVSTPPTPPAPATTTPKESKWFVRPPSGGQYGPAAETVLRQWITEGRITPDTLVWREGDPEWLKASAAFPELATVAAPIAPVTEGTRGVNIGPVGINPVGANPILPGPTVPAAPSGETDAATAAAAMLMARRKRARSTGLLVMGILSIAVLILLVVLVIVLTRQPEATPPAAAAWRAPAMVKPLLDQA